MLLYSASFAPQSWYYEGITKTIVYVDLCISYVTAIRYVAAINHEARGRAAPEGERFITRKHTVTDVT